MEEGEVDEREYRVGQQVDWYIRQSLCWSVQSGWIGSATHLESLENEM